MNSKKSVFFIVFILILAFAASTVFGVRNQYGDLTTTYIKGLKDIRLGIDIQGGVDVTFAPADESIDASKAQLEAVQEVMKARLVTLGINDYEVYIDESNDKVIVRFPWQTGESNFDPQAAVKELGDTAQLQFRKGYRYSTDVDDEGTTTITPEGDIILQGTDVEEAYVTLERDSSGNQTGGYSVALSLKESGKEAFRQATHDAVAKEAEYLDFNGRLCVSLYEPAKDTGALDVLLAQAQARCEGREAANLMRQTLIQLDGLQGFRPESFLNSLCPQGGLIRLPALQGALNDPLSYINRVKRQNALRPAQTPGSARTIGFQSHTMGGM